MIEAEKIVGSVGEQADRRNLLKKAGSAAVAGALLLSGVKVSESFGYGSHNSAGHGCDLCNSVSSCNYTCSWCWWGRCHTNVGGSSHHQTLCCEGYHNYPDCTGGCGGSQYCSFYGQNIAC